MSNTLELTPVQQQFVDEQVTRAKALGSTPIDKATARKTIRDLYANAKYESIIPVFYARSPIEAAVLVHDEDKGLIKWPAREKGQSDAEYLAALDAYSDTIVPSLTWQEVLSLPETERNAILNHTNHSVDSEYRLAWAAALRIADYLGHPLNRDELNIYLRSGEDIGWILPYTEACIMIERPTLRFDAEDNYHGDGVPAIGYSDGFGIYYWHRTAMPAKYGSVPSEHWDAKWLLDEDNSELRKILIEQIGYDRIITELDGKLIDTWVQPPSEGFPEGYTNKYDLVHFDGIDVEKVALLKMTCPSTNHIHTLRVDPNLTSAREAIKWVNWDTDPTEFAQQS